MVSAVPRIHTKSRLARLRAGGVQGGKQDDAWAIDEPREREREQARDSRGSKRGWPTYVQRTAFANARFSGAGEMRERELEESEREKEKIRESGVWQT